MLLEISGMIHDNSWIKFDDMTFQICLGITETKVEYNL